MEKFFGHIAKFAEEVSAVKRDEIGAEIWQSYGVTKSVLIFDMAGFSYTAKHYGSIHFLSMINKMQMISHPIIEEHNGMLVKYEADNGFAVFDTTQGAIDAAFAMQQSFKAHNLNVDRSFAIEISCGIATGEVLLINDQELYGHSVNMASKLGEDLASSGEVFVERSALTTDEHNERFTYTPQESKMGEIMIAYWSVADATV